MNKHGIPNEELLTKQEVAELFRVDIRTVTRWLAGGYFTKVQPGTAKSTVYIPRAEVEAVLNGGDCQRPYMYKLDGDNKLKAVPRRDTKSENCE